MHSAIAWFTRNPVAANLLMFILLVGGIGAWLTIPQEEFPNIDVKTVTVTVPYLGAAPEEAELGVCLRIEEALEGIEGIEEIEARATEGTCTVAAKLIENTDDTVALNEIKSRVDGITTLPRETERPIVTKITISSGALQLAVSGRTDERTLKELGKTVRDEIAAMDGISTVGVEYIRPYEISIEVSEHTLRRYGLTLEAIAEVIRRSRLDMPGGSLRTEGGEILLRTQGQAYWGEQFEDIAVLTRSDGTQLMLSEIASIRDGFEEGDLRARFNGDPAVIVNVVKVGEENVLTMVRDILAWKADFERTLPPGIHLTVWNNKADALKDRLSTLNGMALSGLVLVLVVLTLFLKFRVALWVAAGIPIALLGAIAVFPYAGITISAMTVMAFILVLGILVDDAIVVGERVFAHEQMGKTPIQAAIDGTWEVSVPVIFGVLTTMAAFLPLILATGRMSEFFSVIGWVVIIALVFSIVESQWILPAHLAHRSHRPPGNRFSQGWTRFQSRLADGLERFADQRYLPLLERAVNYRYVTSAICLSVLILSLALIVSGRVIFSFFPAIEGDRIYATLEMPEGVSVEVTARAAEQIEAGASRLAEALAAELEGKPVVSNLFSSIGKLADRSSGPSPPPSPGRSHLAEVVLELVPLEERNDLSSKVVAKRWRELVGDIPAAVKLSFSADTFSAGDAINYELSAKSLDLLQAAAEALKAEIARYDGVYDLTDSFRAGKQEIKLALLPEARNLGITLNDLAAQVRYAFYGLEAQRIQRGQDDVRVMVRFPEAERQSIGDLEDMYIRAPDGTEVPFYSVATFELSRGYSTINRIDGRRVLNVVAEVDRATNSPEAITASIDRDVLPKLRAQFPQVKFNVGGEPEERKKAFTGLALAALLSLIVIYTLLAIPLKSYLQPLVIMSVIPFGAVGAICGHWLLGYQLMFFSALGIVALSGVVVNSSLVLVDYINRRRHEAMALEQAVLQAGRVRFRPIILTSVTTFVGLIPLMSTASPTTAFFIPMAISLAFGVLFATFITLLLVPSLYRIVEDWLGLLQRLSHRWQGDDQPADAPRRPAAE